jgi:hypothetical protein
MPWVGFEPTIPTFERTKTVHALDHSYLIALIPSDPKNFLGRLFSNGPTFHRYSFAVKNVRIHNRKCNGYVIIIHFYAWYFGRQTKLFQLLSWIISCCVARLWDPYNELCHQLLENAVGDRAVINSFLWRTRNLLSRYKVKLPSAWLIKHYAMKTYERVEV